MATGKSYFARNNNYRFLSTDYHAPRAQEPTTFELDESDVYSTTQNRAMSPEVLRPAPIRGGRKPAAAAAGATESSLPVNIPDWSKILKEEYRDQRRRRSGADNQDRNDHNDYEDDVDGGECFDGSVPPHEFLARQMARTRVGVASFSVHEGIGRTLKGRDLSRVRNAIWEKTGFQD